MDFFALIILSIVSVFLTLVCFFQWKKLKTEMEFAEYLKRELKATNKIYDNACISIQQKEEAISNYRLAEEDLLQKLKSSNDSIAKYMNELTDAKNEIENIGRKYKEANTARLRAELQLQNCYKENMTKKELKKFFNIKNEAEYDRFVALMKRLKMLEATGRGIHTRYKLWFKK